MTAEFYSLIHEINVFGKNKSLLATVTKLYHHLLLSLAGGSQVMLIMGMQLCILTSG